MPVSTSGISVPSLGQGIDTSIYNNQNAPKSMSIADMLNISKGQLELQKARETLQPSIEEAKAKSQFAQTEADASKLKLMYAHAGQSSRDLLKILNSQEPVTPDVIKNHVIKTMENAGASPQAMNAALMDLPKTGTDKELRAFVARHATNSIAAEAQLEKLFPSAQFVTAGNEIKPVSGGSPYLSYGQPGQQVGPGIKQELPPTTEVVTPSGDKYVVGGSTGPLQTQLSPTTTETFKVANADYTNAKPALQNISNLETINSKVLQLLTDPKVSTGPVTAKIKDATSNISLNKEQQELVKYLEQRIQNAGSADERASLRTALGSIGTDKTALKHIIKSDVAELKAERFKNEQIIREAGVDATRPDLNRITKFTNKWSQIKDPQVIRFMEAVGPDINNPIDKEDAAYFLKPETGYLAKLPPEKRAQFLDKYRSLRDLMSK